jgi:23S rRNA pseudouridine2605 synthase
MKLTEGKNREIRKIMQSFSLTIKKLKRIKYGPLELGSLKPGEIKEITKKNIFSFFKFVNYKDANNFW